MLYFKTTRIKWVSLFISEIFILKSENLFSCNEKYILSSHIQNKQRILWSSQKSDMWYCINMGTYPVFTTRLVDLNTVWNQWNGLENWSDKHVDYGQWKLQESDCDRKTLFRYFVTEFNVYLRSVSYADLHKTVVNRQFFLARNHGRAQ